MKTQVPLGKTVYDRREGRSVCGLHSSIASRQCDKEPLEQFIIIISNTKQCKTLREQKERAIKQNNFKDTTTQKKLRGER